MIVSKRLREAREYLGVPVPYLASETGLQADLIESFERGERTPTDLELRRLGRVLGYPIAYIRGETGPLPPDSLQAVMRWAEELDDEDRKEALRFAEYLHFAALSEADAAG